jgi:MOSC domain-containing protein YiiM
VGGLLSLNGLLNGPMRAGVVTWIGVRPARREALVSVGEAELDPASGLLGDHYRGRTNQARQVTLISAEQIAAIGSYLGVERVGPEQLRRNIVVSGINLAALKGQMFRLGSAVLLATGECHPCSRMEEVFGQGGYNAVRGHGGITARIIEGGRVRVGDPIVRVAAGDGHDQGKRFQPRMNADDLAAAF